MENPNLPRAVTASVIGNGIMLVFYMTLGLTCYLSFVGEKGGVDSDFIKTYGNDVWISVSRGLLSVNMITAGSLTFVPALKSFYILLARRVAPMWILWRCRLCSRAP